MIEYTKYDAITGEILATGTAQEQCLHLYEPCIQKKCDLFSQYIDVDKKIPVYKGDKPSEFHDFDYASKNWILNIDKATSTNREKRNNLLQESDWTQLSDVDLNSQEKELWKAYRKQLRDMTENDLINGNFPNKP